MTRDELYQRFGPKLIETIVLVVRDEINLLRSQHSLPERTNQDIIDALSSKLSNISNYDWMENYD